ncbi:hypothetical protein [Ideonella paludis]|uniref:hypothetical protein n=1 Tax=Ideonella paludis TaxID=1233411 RepID=UPI00287307BC|nr:hypothetical protein [Ideonella paludis]
MAATAALPLPRLETTERDAAARLDDTRALDPLPAEADLADLLDLEALAFAAAFDGADLALAEDFPFVEASAGETPKVRVSATAQAAPKRGCKQLAML